MNLFQHMPDHYAYEETLEFMVNVMNQKLEAIGLHEEDIINFTRYCNSIIYQGDKVIKPSSAVGFSDVVARNLQKTVDILNTYNSVVDSQMILNDYKDIIKNDE